MKWNEVREKYPNRWVLIEALESESKNSKRIVKDMSVINDFTNGGLALKEYAEKHKKDKSREMYVYNTKHKELNIEERVWIGVRKNG
ncbi:hypothetical protein [uncultured Clostridium sp.]|uniref:hypothetical protein n=1 Tax=uncultured Clostridium sp. TaxID=59620 RepID=UPI002605E2A0|nr:hypothetical protein [uncultured Clostridium sp.]